MFSTGIVEPALKTSSESLDVLATGVGVGLAGRIGGRFLGVLENLIAARVLGPSFFGIYALGWVVFRLIEIISPLGFDAGIIKYGAAHLSAGNRRAFNGMIIASIAVSFVVSGIMGWMLHRSAGWIAMHIFGHPDLAGVLKLFAAAIPLSAILSILAAATRTTHNIKYSVASQDLGQPLFTLLALLFFWRAGLNLERFVVADALSYLLALLLSVRFAWILFPGLFTGMRELSFPDKGYFLFSLSSSMSMFISTLVFWVDRLFAGYYLPAGDVGVYQSALQLSVIFSVIMSALSRILVPMFSTFHSEKRFGELEEVFRIGTKWGAYISVPPVVLILLNPSIILSVLFGRDYSAGSIVLLILLAGQAVNLLTGAVGPLLLVGGHQKFVLLLSGCALVLNIILSVALIPMFGIVGAAWANAASMGSIYLLALMFVKLKMRLWPYDRRYLKGFLAAGLAALCAVFLRPWLVMLPLVSLLIQFLVILAIFGLGLKILGLATEDRAFIAAITRRFGLQSKSIPSG